MFQRGHRIVASGAAGLVGHNLIYQLRKQGFYNILAIDKNEHNLKILGELNPGLATVHADLAEGGPWKDSLKGAACLVLLQAQITGKTPEVFERNTVRSTVHVLEAAKKASIPYIVHISSSVVLSVADDDYTRTKRVQEKMVIESGLKYCILRPTLMFGWFDPKHLGWLSRLMERMPVFPVPGNGRFMRQPLYGADFCRVIIHCAIHQPECKVYDIVGREEIDYVDIIKTIKRCKGLKTPIVRVPYWLFYALLKVSAVFSSNPPFTADQLKALTAGDKFYGVDMEKEFGIKPTPFEQAVRETFCDERYSGVVLKR